VIKSKLKKPKQKNSNNKEEFEWLISKERIRNNLIILKNFYAIRSNTRKKILRSQEINQEDADQIMKQFVKNNKKKYIELRIKYKQKQIKLNKMDDIIPPNNPFFKVQKFRIIEPPPIQKIEDIYNPENLRIPRTNFPIIQNLINLTTFNRRQETVEEQTQIEIPTLTPEYSEYSEDENDQLNINSNPNIEINQNLDQENRTDNLNHDEQLTIQTLSDTERTDETTLNVVVEQDTKACTGFKTITLPEHERLPCLKTCVPNKEIKETVTFEIEDDDQDLFSNCEEGSDIINQNENPIMKILKSKNSKEEIEKDENMKMKINDNKIDQSYNLQNTKK
jgi:hypothetical protein